MSRVYDPEFWELGQELGYESALWAEGGGGGKPVTMPPIHVVTIPANAKLVVLRGYSRGSSSPLKADIPVLQALADNIIKRKGTSNQVNRIRIVGHTDSVGTEDANFNLGLSRARVVRKLLRDFLTNNPITKFTPPPFIEGSAGAGLPDRTTASDNRRVEIILE